MMILMKIIPIRIVPYTQTLGESCLVACFLMLLGVYRGLKFNSSLEQELCFEGLRQSKEYYIVGIAKSLYRKFNFPFLICADNKWFAKKIKGCLKEKNILVFHQKINPELIDTTLLEKGKMPIVCIDSYWIGTNYHAPHFIIIEKKLKKYAIIDPWFGRRRYLSREQFSKAIISLKTRRLKYCPLIIALQN